MFPLSDSDFAVLTIQQKIVTNHAERVGPLMEAARHAALNAEPASRAPAEHPRVRPVFAFLFPGRVKRSAGHSLAAEADGLL